MQMSEWINDDKSAPPPPKPPQPSRCQPSSTTKRTGCCSTNANHINSPSSRVNSNSSPQRAKKQHYADPCDGEFSIDVKTNTHDVVSGQDGEPLEKKNAKNNGQSCENPEARPLWDANNVAPQEETSRAVSVASQARKTFEATHDENDKSQRRRRRQQAAFHCYSHQTPQYIQPDVYKPGNPRNVNFLDHYKWFRKCYIWDDRPWSERSFLASDFPDNIMMPPKQQYGMFYKTQPDPRYRTTGNDYGYYPPAPWHVPLQLLPQDHEFSQWHGGHPNGNYRNLSMNHNWHQKLFDDYPSPYRIKEAQRETEKFRAHAEQQRRQNQLN